MAENEEEQNSNGSEVNGEGKRPLPHSPERDEEQVNKKAKIEIKEDDINESRTNLFISNLPTNYNEDMLRAMFLPFGKVRSTRIMLDFNTGISRGQGFVNFAVPQEAIESISQMNGRTIMNKQLIVKFAEVKEKQAPSLNVPKTPFGTPNMNIYVKGLPLTYSDQEVLDIFTPYGKIISHKIMTDKVTGQSNGQAFILFDQQLYADDAVQALNGYILPNTTQPIVVRYADTKEEKQERKIRGMVRQQQLGMAAYTYSMSPYGMPGYPMGRYGSIPPVYGGQANYGGTPYATTQGSAYGGLTSAGSYTGQTTTQYGNTSPSQHGTANGYGANTYTGQTTNSYTTQDVNQYASTYGQVTSGYGTQTAGYVNPYSNTYGYQYGYFQGVQTGTDANNLYVTNLPPSADESLMHKLFSPFGNIVSVRVIKDAQTGRCQGYGFVKMGDYVSATNAIQKMNGMRIEDKYISVSFKTPKKK